MHWILWADGIAALVAGVLTLALSEWLTELYSLPRNLVTFVGMVNLAYSPWGILLATLRRRRISHIVGLASANAFWACVCVGLAIRFRNDASAIGLGVLLFEGLFVSALATLEWRHRHALVD